MKTDIEIAESVDALPITDIASALGLDPLTDIEPYGHDKAKVPLEAIKKHQDKLGQLILVTSINPTASGEGKSTVAIGLADALQAIGKSTMLALREPSLGPVMGVKGGATGGGYSQVIPMADINLHFTGDIHALTAANNALSALIDNHIHQGNALQIDTRRIQWKRVVDLNDRALRQVVVGLGGPMQGVPREDGFDITVASEMMAVLCLATSLRDLKERLSRIVVAYTADQQPITVHQLGAEGVLTVLLKDAIKPNLVQTLAHTPAFIHGGPFANIAHGCNSVIATNAALHLADYVVTEAGFGSDLGGEKFMNIVSPQLDQQPGVAVIVVTTKAIKQHAGIEKEALQQPNITAIQQGFENVRQHIQHMQQYHIPVVVAINQFDTDDSEELCCIQQLCRAEGVEAIPTTVWKDGADGGIALAQHIVEVIDHTHFEPLYKEGDVLDTLQSLTKNVYGGRQVVLSPQAKKDYDLLVANHWHQLPVCVAKTPTSLSDRAEAIGRPTDFDITIQRLIPKIGAGFVVALTGTVLTMPGLPKSPAALNIDIDNNGQITGLF